MPLAIDQHTRILSGVVPLCVDVDVPPPPLLGKPGDLDEARDGGGMNGSVRTGHTWTIYALTNRADGRVYVGLTRRSVVDRMRSHIQQAKRDRPIRAGGLMEAVQEALSRDQTFAQAFSVKVVGTANSKADAQSEERIWIERLGSRYPQGLNSMPGGSSVGGIDNARTLTFKFQGVRRQFSTIQSAIDWATEQLQVMDRPLVDAGTIYARLAMKWRPAEALGLVPHRDGRGPRETFMMDGKSYRTLAEASAKSGLSINSLRLRLHRQRVISFRIDLSIDRRQAIGPRGPRVSRQVPVEPRESKNRRKLIVLTLPSGSRLIGGEREVIGQVLS